MAFLPFANEYPSSSIVCFHRLHAYGRWTRKDSNGDAGLEQSLPMHLHNRNACFACA